MWCYTGQSIQNETVLSQQNYGGSRIFVRNWADYKAGFEQQNGNFWIDNDRLHGLTKDG